jgi:hypothetical protein
MAYLEDIKGQQKLETDDKNVAPTTQIHYHIEKTENWTKASVIIAGVGVLLGIINILKGNRK